MFGRLSTCNSQKVLTNFVKPDSEHFIWYKTVLILETVSEISGIYENGMQIDRQTDGFLMCVHMNDMIYTHTHIHTQTHKESWGSYFGKVTS